MQVQDVMTRDVASCNPGTNTAAATEIMWNRNCGFLPIVEEGKGVVGIVTDRDLLIALGTRNRNAADLPVGEVMNREPAFCGPESDVRDALKTMAERKVRRLPVMSKDGELKGILSLDDIALRAQTDHLSKDLLRTLKAIADRGHQRAAPAVA